MKKLNLSLVTVLAMSTFAIAGGDIAPVEPMIETPLVVVEESTPGSFYLGGAYSLLNAQRTNSYNENGLDHTATKIDTDFNEFMIQAGYNFNQYVAVEGRYWFGIEDSFASDSLDFANVNYDNSVDAWGIYVKPQYPIGEAFNVYALLGYASSEYNAGATGGLVDAGELDGFSWGLGAGYAFTENVSVFVDYVELYNDDNGYTQAGRTDGNIEDQLDTWNFGVTYTF